MYLAPVIACCEPACDVSLARSFSQRQFVWVIRSVAVCGFRHPSRARQVTIASCRKVRADHAHKHRLESPWGSSIGKLKLQLSDELVSVFVEVSVCLTGFSATGFTNR